MENALNNLQNRNNILKSKLVHEQLKYNIYPFNSFRREMSQLLNEYYKHKSIFKAASILGLNLNMVMKWYIQGQRGNIQFKSFYLRINHINNLGRADEDVSSADEVGSSLDEEVFQDYVISRYGDGWSYTCYVDGEKVFLISGDLDNLKSKVKSQNLPLN